MFKLGYKKVLSIALISFGMFSSVYSAESQDEEYVPATPSQSQPKSPSKSKSQEESIEKVGLPNIKRSSYINAVVNQLYELKHFRELVNSYEETNNSILALKYMFSLINKKVPLIIDDFLKFSKDLGYTEKEKYIGETLNGWIFSSNPDLCKSLNYTYIFSGYTLITRKVVDGYLGSLEEILSHHYLKEDKVDKQICCTINRFYKGTKYTSFPISVSEELMYQKAKKYRLKGVIVRIGNKLDDSHCVSYKVDESGKWYSYDDLEVKEVSWEEVKREAEINGEFFRFSSAD